MGALSILLIPKYRQSFIQIKKTLTTKIFSLIFGQELLNLSALVLSGIALSLGSVTLVSSLFTFQSLFLLIFIVILSRYFPSLYKENISKTNLTQKLIAIMLMIVGFFLIGGY